MEAKQEEGEIPQDCKGKSIMIIHIYGPYNTLWFFFLYLELWGNDYHAPYEHFRVSIVMFVSYMFVAPLTRADVSEKQNSNIISVLTMPFYVC